MADDDANLVDVGLKGAGLAAGAAVGAVFGGPIGAILGAGVSWAWANARKIHEHDMNVDPAGGYFHP